MMNRLERSFTLRQEAELRYLDSDFQILKNGDHVKCAVTGQPIRINELKYWSVAHQEAYINAEASLKRHLQKRGQ